MINLITDLISFTQPTNLDRESLSVIESIAKIKTKINECINEFNKLEVKTSNDYKNFLNQISIYQNEINNKFNELTKDNEEFKIEFKELINNIKVFNVTLDYIKEQSRFVQELAKQNQKEINKGTVATKDDIINVNNDITLRTYYITPEMYGCKGDGLTDDTEGFIEAITHSFQTGVLLKSNKSKTYLVNRAIDVNGYFNVDLDGATIKYNGTENIECFLRFGMNESNIIEQYGGQFKNIKIDGNNLVKMGLNLWFGRKAVFQNIECKNCIEVGIRTGDNHEVTMDTLNIESCECGLLVEGSDTHFNNVYTRYCKNGIYFKNGHNILTSAHGWLNNSEDFEGSVFIKLEAPQTLTNIYSDTYQTGIQWLKSSSCTICGLRFDYVKNIVGDSTCYCFKFDNENYSKNVKLVSMTANGTGIKLNFSNLDVCYVKFDNDACNIFDVINTPKGIISKLNYLNENFTVITNNIVKKNNRINVDLCLLCNTEITSEGLLVCTLDNNFYPNDIKCSLCSYGSSLHTVDDILYVTLSTTGGLRIKRLNSKTNISNVYIYINFCYDIDYIYN